MQFGMGAKVPVVFIPSQREQEQPVSNCCAVDLRRYLGFVIVFATALVWCSTPDPTLEVPEYLAWVSARDASDQALMEDFDQALDLFAQDGSDRSLEAARNLLWSGINRRGREKAVELAPAGEPICAGHAKASDRKGEALQELMLARMKLARVKRKGVPTHVQARKEEAALHRLESLNSRLSQLRAAILNRDSR